MADTVINTPVVRDMDSGANAMGWAVAILLLLGLVLFGLFVWPGINASTPAAAPSGIDVNVRLPEGTLPTTNNSDTNSGGNTQQVPNSGGMQVQ